jgi:hypothetical protein
MPYSAQQLDGLIDLLVDVLLRELDEQSPENRSADGTANPAGALPRPTHTYAKHSTRTRRVRAGRNSRT